MNTLLLFLPPRTRLRAPGKAAPAAPEPLRPDAPREYDWALTSDGRQISSEGRGAASALPAADAVVAVIAESDLSWRCVELPRAGRQMRAALAGKLEEQLLDDPDTLHFALEPDAEGGDNAWVAITSRVWLSEHLAHLDAAHVFIDRVAPLAWPDELPRGHFFETHGVGSDDVALRWSHSDGVATLPLQGALSRQFFPPGLVHAAQWTATPGAAAAAERWLGTAVGVQTPAQRALAVVESAWNLRQFDLAPRARGTRALRMFGRELMRKPWQPVRWGLALLLVIELLGLNLRAWRLNAELKAKRADIAATLTAAFPQIRNPLDPPVQMQRNMDLLRASAGSVGDQDLEALLAAAATAWPADRPPAEALAFEPGRLTVSAQGWAQPQIDNFRTQLLADGWQLDASEGKLTLSRAAPQGSR
ncbi:type II secretion system protein GspL [Roseateles asaccharophilus]|uniref:General secretion pathway protein L n=1 Tax=Roseateles asaccharophilus TaxID=582607 RepID=A0ABU2A4P6_9BURK|nr:type II secretion system protein GspL [Roseateles asaccharophilus]MDR7331038.1 general secretion pathway protein L [Roseateles asaccharophilus]